MFFCLVLALGLKAFILFRIDTRLCNVVSYGTRSFNEVVGYRRLDELNQKLESFSNRVLKEQCLDLPDKMYTKNV